MMGLSRRVWSFPPFVGQEVSLVLCRGCWGRRSWVGDRDAGVFRQHQNPAGGRASAEKQRAGAHLRHSKQQARFRGTHLFLSQGHDGHTIQSSGPPQTRDGQDLTLLARPARAHRDLRGQASEGEADPEPCGLHYHSRNLAERPRESPAPQVSHQGPSQLNQLCHHAAADGRAAGRELGGRHQEHRAAAGPRGDVRVCRRICPRRHGDSEHSDRRRRCLPEPVCPHIHGLPPAVHLPYAGDHQLQSGI
ncbi:vacuolar protein sorting-associated protein 26C isoform X5 [Lynx rufus]|uniref:vacuolar protein sorting-associated protein 26C isoform X5 n=1 Tax=Lynx rufus TaxID=61384 RepID=UPI001F126FEC|nr:vacuolar protein sorting-associated protein 26C isoform X5 [Lynx rufus]